MWRNTIKAMFGDYPVRKSYNDQRIPLIVALASASFYTALLIFYVLTQGRTSTQETILLAHPKNGVDSQGQETQCMAASIKVCDNIYTVQPVNQDITSSLADDTGVAVVPGPFRWTVWSVVPTPNKKPAAYSSLSNLGFQYMEESLSCNITDARFTYYLKPRPKFKSKYRHKHQICGSCYSDVFQNTVHLCSDFDSSTSRIPKFASKFYGRLEQVVFSSARRLSFEKFNLDNVQSLIPSDSPKRLESTDITQVEISLKKMAFVPSPKSTLNTSASLRDYQMEGSLYLGKTSELTDPWAAFMNIKFIESTFFKITFKEDIEVRLIMNESNLLKMPSALSLLFSEQLEIISWLVDSTGSDLHNRSFGVSYTCTRTKKPWKQPLSLISSTVANSAGAFSFGMWLIVFIACKFDQRNQKAKKTDIEIPDSDDDQKADFQVSKKSPTPD